LFYKLNLLRRKKNIKNSIIDVKSEDLEGYSIVSPNLFVRESSNNLRTLNLKCAKVPSR